MTKIFLDSGDPKETKQALATLGYLDGQTTNPSLIAKNPEAVGKKFSKQEVWDFYKNVVQEISKLIPNGSVSIEVEATASTSHEAMFKQAQDFFSWIPNAHIKFPTTKEGLKAAKFCVAAGIRVNMTLVFNEAQAAAVYAATMGAKKGDVFLSPFVGRLDDIGLQGTDLIGNIVKMFKQGDGHVEVLSASVRSLDHFLTSISLGADIITAPLKVLKEWSDNKFQNPNYKLQTQNLKTIPYEEINLNQPWENFNIEHELTTRGLLKFTEDWEKIIK